SEPLGGAKHPARLHVLAQHEDALVLRHLLVEGGAHGLDHGHRGHLTTPPGADSLKTKPSASSGRGSGCANAHSAPSRTSSSTRRSISSRSSLGKPPPSSTRARKTFTGSFRVHSSSSFFGR